MIPGKRADRIPQIADTVTKTEAALGELHRYYRFGRHQSPFPQKLYFLFSHCAHLLFSVWLDEQDRPHKVFTSGGLTALFDQADFGALRYLDYSRRMLYANAYEEHLKNEPKWFKFWVRLLQGLQGADVAGSEEFARRFSACLADCSLLEGRLARRDHKTLAALVQGSRAGRLLLHSIWILEDVISTASAYIAERDPTVHAIEQMQCLICLLSQLRRGIVWETMAGGPHTLSADSGWHVPSTLDRFLGRRIAGTLTVTLTQASGDVTCKHEPTPDSRTHERTWARSIATLPSAYEELLFKTWPLELQERPSDGQTPAPGQARWIVQAVEAGHLETISRHADRLLEALGKCPAYGSLVQTAAHALRNGRGEWTCSELPWDYLRELDQLISKLRFACREAKVLGGQHPAEKVVANLWPPQVTMTQEADTAAQDAPSTLATAADSVEKAAGSDALPTKEETAEAGEATEDEHDAGSQPPPVQQKSPEVVDDPPPVAPAPANQPDDVELADIESLMQPECYKACDDAEQKPIPSEEHPAMTGPDRLERLISLIVDGEDRTAQPAPASNSRQSLLWRLLEWHQPSSDGAHRDPLSLVQLQRDLGWSQSQVLQEMSRLFGSKPFAFYRQKCLDRSIRSFLETRRVHFGNRIETDAQTSSLSTR
ncbi:MAG: hypothetical protein JW955_20765 [Sedimentisphaerales bacterium]|nr:hypothetical protein [Sedimentisphaerales bacterium]